MIASNPKSIWKSKTFWFNIATVMVLIGDTFANVSFVKSEYIIMISGMGNIILRMITTDPVVIK